MARYEGIPIKCKVCGSAVNIKRDPSLDDSGPGKGRVSRAYRCTACDVVAYAVIPIAADTDANPTPLSNELLTSPTAFAIRLRQHACEVAGDLHPVPPSLPTWDELSADEKLAMESIAARIQSDLLDVANITHFARCEEHGLHGRRDNCFVCGGPVEQVAMVPLRNTTSWETS